MGALRRGGCLFLFVFPPFGIFLLLIAAMTQFLLKKAIPGICPYCGQDTGTIGERGAQAVFPCVHCQRPIRIDMSAGKRTFVKAAGTPGTPAGSQKKPLWDKTGQ